MDCYSRGRKRNKPKTLGISFCITLLILIFKIVSLKVIDLLYKKYYPSTIMSSLVTKWKKNKPYLYWVRSARVQGKPRIVEQIYLGPRERVLPQRPSRLS